MFWYSLIPLLTSLIASSGEQMTIAFKPHPPIAEKIPKTLIKHKDRRIDNYFWMRERENPKVLEYLNNENQYLKQVMAPTESLQVKILNELKARIKEDESSAPFKKGDYYYWARFQKGYEYPQFLRKKISGSDKENNTPKEELLLDANELAKGQKYFDIGSRTISSNQNMLAYSTDTVGRRFYNIKFKSISDNMTLKDEVKDTTGNVIWLDDNKTILFSKQDPETLRSFQIYRYTIGGKEPQLVYEEKDPQFYVSVEKALTQNEVYINCRSNDSTEVLVSKNNATQLNFQIVLHREARHEYSVSDGGDKYFILTNFKAKNFRVVEVEKGSPQKKNWREIIPHKASTLIDDILVFKNHVVLQERSGGLTQLSYITRDNKKPKKIYLKFPDPNYVASLGQNAEYESTYFRYDYQSLTAPETVFDYYFEDKKSKTIKTEEVPTYNSKFYFSERVWAKAKDGAKIPVSIVYKKSLFKKS